MFPIAFLVDFIQAIMSRMESLARRPENEQETSKTRQLQILNYLGISYALGFSLLLFCLTFFITIPFTFDETSVENDGITFYRCCLAYFYMNFIANYIMLSYAAKKSVYCSPKDLPMHSVATQEDWIKCNICDQAVPPRTHHCALCNICILKRDHHCFFSGCCIGFHNQRYFICAAFHAVLLCLMSFYFATIYLSAHYVTFLGPEFFKYFLPYATVVFLFGSTSFVIYMYIVFFYLNFTSLLASVFYFVWQLNVVNTGQTSYEFIKGRKTYQSKLPTHIRSVFGPLFLLNFIFPMPWLQNEGNGKSWPSGNTKFL